MWFEFFYPDCDARTGSHACVVERHRLRTVGHHRPRE
jgi:hypothetical protein